MIELKPCPHCGGAPYLHQTYSYKYRRHYISIVCGICGSQSKGFSQREDSSESDWTTPACFAAAQAWNMRTKGDDT